MRTKQIPFVLFTFLALILINNACKQQSNYIEATYSPQLSAYIYAYTSGVISKAQPIKVRFSQQVVKEANLAETPKNLLRFNPSIAGEHKWLDEQTLTFIPNDHLNSNTTYTATLDLTSLYAEVPDDLKDFKFSFKTREQYIDIQIDKVESIDFSDLSKQSIIGSIVTADIADPVGIESAFQATQNGKSLPVQWAHINDQTIHQFVVYNAVRGEKPSSVSISLNGKTIGVTAQEKQEVKIPALGDFSVTKAQVAKGDEQYIELQFSDPLQPDQDLNGLITINGYNDNLRFLIDGNQVRIYPRIRLTGERTVNVLLGIKNINGDQMPETNIWQVNFEDIKPQVRLVGEGVILPDADALMFPFEAVNLNAVEVEIFKIYNNNILQFLQTNELDGSSDLNRVGKVIMQQRVDLQQLNSQASQGGWKRYALDLKSLIDNDPKAIYQVRIGFRPEYSNYFCSDKNDIQDANFNRVTDNTEEEIQSFWGNWYGINGYYEDYRWEHREDPCKPAYYNYDNFISRNVVNSNLGIIAKAGRDGSMLVAVTDLIKATPIANTSLKFYDYQQQLITTAQTDASGMAKVILPRTPFAVIAEYNVQTGYLKLQDGEALSMSRFNVAGAVTQKGMKGFIYGDRAIWRPGDSLFLNFILEDENATLPSNYPITFELYDSRGQLQGQRTTTNSIGNIYALHTATAQDAPTGNWTAKVKAGGAEFTKTLKIETIKPNRLNVNLDFGKEELSYADEPIQGEIQVNWLYGAPAQNLKTVVELEVKSTDTKFEDFNEYEFDDPARKVDAEPKVVFDGQVNTTGQASFSTVIAKNINAPGKLVAKFRSRAFEPGGDFSTSVISMPYAPYRSYAGVYIPENKYGEKRLEIDRDEQIELVAVNEKGQAINNKNLSIGLYRLEWRWWWDQSYDNISRYSSSQHFDAIQTTTITTNSKGQANWNVKVDDWGRYLVRVCDTESGHCSGEFFYAGYPWYDDDGQNRAAAAMLAFSTDKDKYEVGEKIQVNVPASAGGQALITIEDGTKVIASYWEKTKAGDNVFTIPTTDEMAPNVYIHLSLIQPHGQTENDLPIRMYGVANVAIENSKTRLQPIVKMPDALEPEKTFTIEVAEKNKQPMAYTIALVDEGLLNLTNFKTPNPHDAFYAREALGVQTWDVYDHVIGVYSGALERILSIGGDVEITPTNADNDANRFKPVVKHLGPFYLQKGKTDKHTITMPNYVGSVRTMIVAANQAGAYGNGEVATPVKSPLMVLATLPRVLGAQEQLKLPISVFVTDPKVKNVKINIEETSGLVRFAQKTQQLQFNGVGEQLVEFDVEVLDAVGVANFKIDANGNGESASQAIEIQVRNPNPYVSEVQQVLLEQNQSHRFNFTPIGVLGTNTGTLEISSIPPIDLGKRLDYLIRYPHGCIEQTVSAGFPQLYIANLLELDNTQKDEIQRNVVATIEQLKQFQTNEGGFAYWQGEEDANAWGTSYTGHFLLEAQQQGYAVSSAALNRWKAFQKRRANLWTNNKDEYRNYDLDQAYRLFTLALAGEPALSAMNRMRTLPTLSVQAKWRLAAAYAITGKKDIAQQLISNVNTDIPEYQQLGYTYGSDVRDEAMIVESLVLLDDRAAAMPIIQRISEELSTNEWMSTQTVAYALLSISKFVGNNKTSDTFNFTYQIGGSKIHAGSSTPIVQVDIPVDESNNRGVMIENKHSGILYARLILSGQPPIGDQNAVAQNLDIQINYTDSQGKAIDISNLEQGTDFTAAVTVTNTGSRGINYEELALSQVFPSGWEILNSRVNNFGLVKSSIPEYQDIRDDRVYTYFDLNKGNSKTYRIQLNAAYRGRYYLPTVACEAMYDNSIQARLPGKWINVIKSENF